MKEFLMKLTLVDSGGHRLCIFSQQNKGLHHRNLRDPLVMPLVFSSTKAAGVICCKRERRIGNPTIVVPASWDNTEEANTSNKEEKTPKQCGLPLFPTSQPVRGRRAINQPRRCNT